MPTRPGAPSPAVLAIVVALTGGPASGSRPDAKLVVIDRSERSCALGGEGGVMYWDTVCGPAGQCIAP